MTRSIGEFIERLARDGIAQREQLRGCSSAEIDLLERNYKLKLPASYRRYLEVMGHETGRLFRYDYFTAHFEDVLRMTAEERDYSRDEGTLADMRHALGGNGLLIVGRLTHQYFFIRCAGGADAAVSYVESGDWKPRAAYPAVLDLLNAIADECAEAVRDGYFGAPDAT